MGPPEMTLQLVVVLEPKGRGVRCVYLGDRRIAGGKPYASEDLPHTHYTVPMADVLEAVGLSKNERLS